MGIDIIKRKPFSVRTRTRYARLRFSNKVDAPQKSLKAGAIYTCDCSEEGLKTLPEWAPVKNEKNIQYRCNITNLLEVGALKMADEDGYKDWYYMVSKAGAFFTYRKSNNLFYTAVSGLGKVAVQALMGKGASFCALFSEGRYLLVNMDGSYSTIIAEDVVPAGAFFRHRVFVGMKNGVLKYSAPEDFTNFDESVEDGGSIRLTNGGGEIIAVKVFDDALYVFFESGIMRLTIGGDPCEFYVEKIDYAGGDIFSRTICVCDHAIYFMSQGGVYCLKGKRAERLDLDVGLDATLPYQSGGQEGCAVWKGMPLFRYKDSGGVMRTLAIRSDGSSYFMMDLEGLCQGENGKVLFVDGAKTLQQLVDDDQGESWTGADCATIPHDLGYSGNKTIKKLRFVGKGTLTISVVTKNVSMYKMLEFSDGFAEWPIIVRGETFTFFFSLGRASKVTEMIVEFDMLTSYKEGK